jgi:4-alpha-glucanotransferase
LSPRHDWIENFALPLEHERGLPDRDSHLAVAEARLELLPDVWVGLAAGLDADADPDVVAAMERFRARDASLLDRALAQVPGLKEAPDWIRRLVLAADTFVFARPVPDGPDGESVIAGYPWFGDWGRDTMISLPGLTLATGRQESARRVLATFARFVDGGMLPNVFPGSGDHPEYNTADASLWFVEAWRAYIDATGDTGSLRRAFPVLEDIVAKHQAGTRHGIAMDASDGLLRAGEPGVQVTWMDAKVGDWVVTPRIGKPVEINALWYNATCAMAELAAAVGRDGGVYRTRAEVIRIGFRRFVRPDGRGLYDVLDGPGGADASVRPNQIFAVSLPHSPLDKAQQAAVVATCARELLTSYGVRSLAPYEPDFKSVYRGGVWERDGAYHQGPVWAWLLGHFALAEHRVTGDAQAAMHRLEPMRDHLSDAGLGTISEIFDGAAPHVPRGAPAQAWSVACTLEAWWRLERARRAAAKSQRTDVAPKPRRQARRARSGT